MPSLRIASINGEWMNNWFSSDSEPVAFLPSFRLPGEPSSTPPHPTCTTAQRLANVIRAIDPHILAILEAPSRKEELDLFINRHLSGPEGPTYVAILGDSGGAQKLGLLYKPAVVTASLTPSASIQTLLEPWEADVDGDMFLDPYQFTRTPLVVDAMAGPHSFQMIVMHTKSSFVNQGEAMWNDPARRQQYVVAALMARRRNGAEAMRARQYLDERLDTDLGTRIILLGDLNDGPGLDYFEQRYLAHNVTDILVGSAFKPEYVFTHAQHDVPPAQRFTAVFDDFVTGEQNKQSLLDHILLSPGFNLPSGLRKVPGSGTIHHTEYLAEVVNNGTRREDRPSDHRPVSVMIEF